MGGEIRACNGSDRTMIITCVAHDQARTLRTKSESVGCCRILILEKQPYQTETSEVKA